MKQVLLNSILCLFIIMLVSCSNKKPIEPVNINNNGNKVFFPFIDFKEASKHIDILELSKTTIPLSRNAIFYVMPTKYERLWLKTYEDNYTQMIKNYIVLNALGDITDEKNKADYYIIASAKESIKSYLSENFSFITFTVFTMKDVPIFHIKMKVTSGRNNNFYYYPSIPAIPPDYLTQTGFIYLLDKYFKFLFEGGR